MSSGCISDRFQVGRQLGQGGAGRVFVSEDLHLGRQAALKFLKPELHFDRDWVARFLREAQTMIRLDHPGILRCYSVRQIQEAVELDGMNFPPGNIYIVLEYVDGLPLSRCSNQIKTSADLKNLLVALANALQYAHENGVVHRDLKTENILIAGNNSFEKPKIVDFGLVHLLIDDLAGKDQRLTQTGELLGSPHYMSPEQCLGGVPDGRSDIYALGCILYELLTGKVPFDADTYVGVMFGHMNAPPPEVRLRGDLDGDFSKFSDMALTCLAKDPAKRYQTAAELIADLESDAPRHHAQHSNKRSHRPNSINAIMRRRHCAIAAGAFLTLILFTVCLAQDVLGRIVVNSGAVVPMSSGNMITLGKLCDTLKLNRLEAVLLTAVANRERDTYPLNTEQLLDIIDHTSFGELQNKYLLVRLLSILRREYADREFHKTPFTARDFHIFQLTCRSINRCKRPDSSLLHSFRECCQKIVPDLDNDNKVNGIRTLLGLDTQVTNSPENLTSTDKAAFNVELASIFFDEKRLAEADKHLAAADIALSTLRITPEGPAGVALGRVLWFHDKSKLPGEIELIFPLIDKAERTGQAPVWQLVSWRRQFAQFLRNKGRYGEASVQYGLALQAMHRDLKWLHQESMEPDTTMTELVAVQLKANDLDGLEKSMAPTGAWAQLLQHDGGKHAYFANYWYWRRAIFASDYMAKVSQSANNKDGETVKKLATIYSTGVETCRKDQLRDTALELRLLASKCTEVGLKAEEQKLYRKADLLIRLAGA